jgi:hypothetical protein
LTEPGAIIVLLVAAAMLVMLGLMAYARFK